MIHNFLRKKQYNIPHNLIFEFQRKLVQNNATYVRDIIITRGLELYKSVTNHTFIKLITLKEQIMWESVSPPKPKPAPRTSVPKYSTTEYL